MKVFSVILQADDWTFLNVYSAADALSAYERAKEDVARYNFDRQITSILVREDVAGNE